MDGSVSHPRKKFKRDESSESIDSPTDWVFYYFLEYAWNEKHGQCSFIEEANFRTWIVKFDAYIIDSVWYTTSDTDGTEPFEPPVFVHKYHELAYTLRRIIPSLMNLREVDSGNNIRDHTVLHAFLNEYHNKTENLTEDHMFRLRRLMKNLAGKEQGIFYLCDNYGKTPLHLAVTCKNSEILQVIISSLTDVSLSDEFGNTALHIIVDSGIDEVTRNRIGYFDAIKTLVSKGANPNATNKQGVSAVHLAAEKFNGDVLKYFAENGADVTQLSEDNETPLFFACKSALKLENRLQMAAVIDFLVRQGCNVRHTNLQGYMPLHYAAEFGTVEIIQRLLNFGADINCYTRKMYFTPLYVAAKSDRLDNLIALVEAGAVVNREAKDGSTALSIAVRMASAECMKYLIDHGADILCRDYHRGFTLYHMAACAIELTNKYDFSGNYSMAKKFDLLSKEHFDVNDSGIHGVTPLQLAVVVRNINAVRILIERGANVNYRRDDSSLSCLHLAVMVKDFEIMKMLMTNGADVNCRADNIALMRPLHMAMIKNTGSELQEWCKENVINYEESKSFIGKLLSPVVSSKSDWYEKAAYTLASNGAHANTKDALGKMPLHLSTLLQSNEATRRLLNLGAFVNVEDYSQRLPIHNVLDNRNLAGFALLLEHGADINDDDTSQQIMSTTDELTNMAIKHAIKLKKIGFSIAKIYEPYLDAPEYKDFAVSCENEAKKLVQEKLIDIDCSYYRYLHASNSKQCRLIPQLMDSYENLKIRFPLYCTVIYATYCECEFRKYLLPKAKSAWRNVETMYMTDICVDNILSHLNNRYLEILIRS